MSDTTTTTTPEATPAAPVQETLSAVVENFSREYVQELRDEAAQHRTSKKTAVEDAKKAKDTEWAEKVSAAQTETTRVETDLGDAWVELQKLYSAIAAGVPSDKLLAFVSVLKGSDADSITESAKSAKELFGGFKTNDPAVDPTQGSGGSSDIPLNGDALMQALSRAVGLPT